MTENLNESSLEMLIKAQQMWRRAVTIVTFETNRNVALAVIRGHLSEYQKLPHEFLSTAVTEGMEEAIRVEREVLSSHENSHPGLVDKAKLARELLIEAGIVGGGTSA